MPPTVELETLLGSLLEAHGLCDSSANKVARSSPRLEGAAARPPSAEGEGSESSPEEDELARVMGLSARLRHQFAEDAAARAAETRAAAGENGGRGARAGASASPAGVELGAGSRASAAGSPNGGGALAVPSHRSPVSAHGSRLDGAGANRAPWVHEEGEPRPRKSAVANTDSAAERRLLATLSTQLVRAVIAEGSGAPSPDRLNPAQGGDRLKGAVLARLATVLGGLSPGGAGESGAAGFPPSLLPCLQLPPERAEARLRVAAASPPGGGLGRPRPPGSTSPRSSPRSSLSAGPWTV